MHMKRIHLSAFVLVVTLGLSCGGDSGGGDAPVIPPVVTDDSGPANSNIPYFVINSGGAAIVDEPKIPGSMAVYVNQQQVMSTPIGVELRGSTSRRLFPKLSYGIETWDESGADKPTTILDFAVEEDYVMYGPYSDKTFLRNKLIYDLSNDIGRWAVKTQLAEVAVNGDYKGVYIFSERIKRDEARVNILKLEPNQTDNSVISGGYIIKIDKTSGDTDNSDWPGDALYSENLGWRSPYAADGRQLEYPAYGSKRGEETYFMYEYPDPDRINNAQKNYIQNYIAGFERALINEDFSGEREYEEYIDVASFVDFFILNELAANADAYRLSIFMHKERNGKLKMGPIWDFNLAFGNDGRSNEAGWIYQYNEREPNDLWLVHFWWPKLLEDPQFRAAIKQRWDELKTTVINQQTIDAKLDAWVTELDQNGAIDRNYTRWPVIGVQLPFNVFVGSTYEEEIEYVKDWVGGRILWMDSQMRFW